MKPTKKTLDIFPVENRPKTSKGGGEWLRSKAKAARDFWNAAMAKSARIRAERKASYAIFAKHAWDKAKAARIIEASKGSVNQDGSPRRDPYGSILKDKVAAEVKAEITYREARHSAARAATKAARIIWKIAQANYKEDVSSTKTTAAIDAAKIIWDKAAEQEQWDKEAVEAVKALNKATVAHTQAKEKEQAAGDRYRGTTHLFDKANATGFKLEVKVAKAEVEVITARSALDWAREAVAAAKLAAKATAETADKYQAEIEVAKAESLVETTMITFVRAKEKSALARAEIKAAHDTAHRVGTQLELKVAKADFTKTAWEQIEAEAACTIAKAEVELAEIVWARANAASAHAVARSEHGRANPPA